MVVHSHNGAQSKVRHALRPRAASKDTELESSASPLRRWWRANEIRCFCEFLSFSLGPFASNGCGRKTSRTEMWLLWSPMNQCGHRQKSGQFKNLLCVLKGASLDGAVRSRESVAELFFRPVSHRPVSYRRDHSWCDRLWSPAVLCRLNVLTQRSFSAFRAFRAN